MIQNSYKFHMKFGSERQKHLMGLSMLTRLGMKRFFNQLVGKPAPETEEFSKERVYELMELRQASELQVVRGLMDAKAAIKDPEIDKKLGKGFSQVIEKARANQD